LERGKKLEAGPGLREESCFREKRKKRKTNLRRLKELETNTFIPVSFLNLKTKPKTPPLELGKDEEVTKRKKRQH